MIKQERFDCIGKVAQKVGALTFACLFLANISFGATVTVAQDGSADYTTIKDAFDAASDGDTILVAPGDYVPAGTAQTAGLLVDKALTIRSTHGPEVTFLSADTKTATATCIHFTITADATISGFTFTNGCNTSKSGSACSIIAKAGTVTNCVFKRMAMGAHVLYFSGNSRLVDCEITDLGKTPGGRLASGNGDGSQAILSLADYASAERCYFHHIKYDCVRNFAVVAFASVNTYLRNSVIHDIDLPLNASADTNLSLGLVFKVGGQLGNTTSMTTGGNVENCTVFDCYSYQYTPVIFYQTRSSAFKIKNSIIYNVLGLSTTGYDHASSSIPVAQSNCWAEAAQMGIGAGNIDVDPLLESGSYRLSAESPLRDRGALLDWMTDSSALDFEKSLRLVGLPDIGACELLPPTNPSAAITLNEKLARVDENFSISAALAQIDPEEAECSWNFPADATLISGGETSEPVISFTTAGEKVISLEVALGGNTIAEATRTILVLPKVCYVEEIGDDEANRAFAYDEDHPARSIQAALSLTPPEIFVGEGNFFPPQETKGTIVVNYPVCVKGAGPEKTIVTAIPDGGTQVDRRHFDLLCEDATIEGFTFRRGYGTSNYFLSSFVATAGLVTNCVFREVLQTRMWGFGYLTGSAKMIGCVVNPGNVTYGNCNNDRTSGILVMGNALISHCVITNYCPSAGHKQNANAAVVLDSASAVLRNSLVANNRLRSAAESCGIGVAFRQNGGKIENCTITQNQNTTGGLGCGIHFKTANKGTVVNSVIYGNVGASEQNGASSQFSYSCSPDLVNGENGNIISDPMFETKDFDFELGGYSPLRDAGTTDGLSWCENSLDLAFLSGCEPRGRICDDAIDIGCYESPKPADLPLGGSFVALPLDPNCGESYRVEFVASVYGSNFGGLNLAWDFGEGSASGAEIVMTNTYTTCGAYDVSLTLSNAVGETFEVTVPRAVVFLPPTIYADPEGGNVFPYMTPQDAGRDLEEVVSLGAANVEAAPGTYQLKAAEGLRVSSAMRVYSREGAQTTIIRACDPLPSAISKARKPLWIDHEEAIVDGFTLTNGSNPDTYGVISGVQADNGLVANCIIAGNQAISRNAIVTITGGACVSNCLIDATGTWLGNIDGDSGSVAIVGSGSLVNSVVKNFKCAQRLSAPVIINGSDALMRNCLVTECQAGGTPGTSINPEYSTLGVVLIRRKINNLNGGGRIENCTIAGNHCANNVGGIFVEDASDGVSIVNTIVYGNTTGIDNIQSGNIAVAAGDLASCFNYSCAPELTAGEGNIAADPRFKGKGANPYQLRATSPCRNAGTLLDWMSAASDLLDSARIKAGAPDIGAYETPEMFPSFLLVR